MATRCWTRRNSREGPVTIIQKGALICTFAIAAALTPWGLRLIPESSPVQRGAAAANADGCIGCHGKSEPGFTDDASLSCTHDDGAHPRYSGRCSDVLAFFEAVRLKRTFEARAATPRPNRLLQGEILARQYNCFQCHGELGQGGLRNAGALKGYIPGFFGQDFAHLTRDGNAASVELWIKQGIDPALYAQPIEGAIAEYFIKRQEVSMPVFESLPDRTIQILADYVVTLNKLGALDADSIRAYGRVTEISRPKLQADSQAPRCTTAEMYCISSGPGARNEVTNR